MKKESIQPGESLGVFVQRIREARGWSPQDVARQSDGALSEGFITMIEAGSGQNPNPLKLQALAKALKLPPDAFIWSSETLGQYAKRIRETNGWSLRDVERQSGGVISDGYINMIETGAAPNPSPKKLKALAKGLKIHPDAFSPMIYQIATSSPETDTEQILIAEFRALDKRAQTDLLKIIRVLGRDLISKQDVLGEVSSDVFEPIKPAKKLTQGVRKQPTKPPK